MGETAGRDPGSFTYKNMIISGLVPMESLDAAAVETLHESGGFTLLRKAGDIVTSDGMTLAGEYIDIIDSRDWVATNIEHKGQKLLNALPKIPYTDAGIAALEGVAVNVLAEAHKMGMIAEEGGAPLYRTSSIPREQTTEEERVRRAYNHLTFEFTLAGAIHNAKFSGSMKF